MESKANSILDSIRDLAQDLLPRGSRLALYGSRARGDYRSDSDWDLHVLIPGENRISWEEDSKYGYPFFKLGLKFGEIVNARVYTSTDWKKRIDLPFYKNVEEDKVIIYQSC